MPSRNTSKLIRMAAVSKADIENAAASLFVTADGRQIARLLRASDAPCAGFLSLELKAPHEGTLLLPEKMADGPLSLPDIVSILCHHLGVPE